MKSFKDKEQIKIQAKRNTELWIYSFADMYMILSVFFIALSVLYAAKAKEEIQNYIPSAGRGPASVVTELQLNFPNGSAELSEPIIDEMRLVLPALRQVKNGFVEIEGYADRSPISSKSGFTSNLDLSTRRAVRVAEWLVKNGVPAHKIRTFSYGDGHQYGLKEVETNRRVLIKLAYYGGKKND